MAHIKDSRSYHFTQKTAASSDYSLWIATAIALLIHVGIIFGISFEAYTSPTTVMQDVAEALTQNLEQNQQADYIASVNQEGSGQLHQRAERTSPDASPLQSNEINQTQDLLNQQQQQRQQQYQESYLRTTLSWRKVSQKTEPDDEKKANDLQEQRERIRQQIATLEAKLASRQQIYTRKTKVKTLDSVSSKASPEANYIEELRSQVEQIGNRYYPKTARAQNLTGDVRLMVIIRNDGSLKAIRLLKSSGERILDEAAKDSVRRSAPFAAFTKEMNEDIIELRLIRTWRFTDTVEVNY